MKFPRCSIFRSTSALIALFSCLFVFSSFSAITPLVQHGDDWRYRKGTNEPPADWFSVADAALDGSWLAGPGGFGYGDGDDATELLDMQGNYSTVYTRQSFVITELPGTEQQLRLSVDYDDGYVAYLDGVEIARSSNVPSVPHPYNMNLGSDSSASVEGGAIAVTDLGPGTDWLDVGTHILAVQGINGDAPSSDLSLIADLYLEEVVILPATNEISGSIAVDMTLYSTNVIYTVTGDLTVEAGVTLTIEPGVTVQFDAGRSMTVFGRLLAEGTELAPITFTRRNAGTTWERIIFKRAEPSVFRHCIVEYSNCAGDHKDYYDNDNDPSTPPLARTYFQAVVALGCHLDFEDCLFRNLPDEGGSAEGDAVAIISDDLDYSGPASASFRNSDFIGIGQGIHTRYAHVFVESCFFTLHNGDNDDIDLYGESMPPSLIVNNTFLDPDSDDAINPTRSSAVMIGNVAGHTGTGRQGDSGVVLRDRSCPVMMNNVIFNANSAGIDVQNTCDALLVNNTIINCGTGINFRDHNTRWGAPYFLAPGAARATIINGIIWDCSRSMNLVDSSSTTTDQPASEATVIHCDVEGGQGSATVSANSTLNWGPGNIDADPLFTNLAGNNYRLLPGSPCIDAGTNINQVVTITNLTGVLTNLTITVTSDLDGVPRPLDGDGNGSALHDMGAFEYLLSTADSNGDTVPDGWYFGFGLNPTDPEVGDGNPDVDLHTTMQEWVADTDPTNGESFFKVESITMGNPVVIQYRTSANRRYTLYYAPDLGDGNGGSVVWTPVAGQSDVAGSGGLDSLSDAEAAEVKFYKIGVALP